MASDWQVSPILIIRSARFFTVTSGTDVALTTAPSQTPNLVNTDPYPGNQRVNSWVSRSAFANSVNLIFPSGLATWTSGILMRWDRRERCACCACCG